MSESELVRSIRSERILPCYFFWGADTATCESFAKRLANKLVPAEARDMNYYFFGYSDFTVSAFSDVCEMLPAFADRVVAVVNDLNAEALRADDLKQLMDVICGIDGTTTTVIFYTSGIDLTGGKRSLSSKNKKLADHISKCGGAVTEFAYKKPSELAGYIQKRIGKDGCFISLDAAQHLAQLLGSNILMIDNECDKLSAYTGSGEVTMQAIELLVSGQIDTDAYKLSKAILSGSRAQAFEILDKLYSKESEAIPLLSVISGAVMDLYRAKAAISSSRGESDVANDFSYRGREFAVRNAFRDCRSMSAEKLRYCMSVLSDCDIDMKSKRTDQRVLLEEAITKILVY